MFYLFVVFGETIIAKVIKWEECPFIKSFTSSKAIYSCYTFVLKRKFFLDATSRGQNWGSDEIFYIMLSKEEYLQFWEL
jgi:hypothetical protein